MRSTALSMVARGLKRCGVFFVVNFVVETVKLLTNTLHVLRSKLTRKYIFDQFRNDLDMHNLFILNVQDGQILFIFGSKVNTPLLFIDNLYFITSHPVGLNLKGINFD